MSRCRRVWTAARGLSEPAETARAGLAVAPAAAAKSKRPRQTGRHWFASRPIHRKDRPTAPVEVVVAASPSRSLRTALLQSPFLSQAPRLFPSSSWTRIALPASVCCSDRRKDSSVVPAAAEFDSAEPGRQTKRSTVEAAVLLSSRTGRRFAEAASECSSSRKDRRFVVGVV